MPIVEHDKLIRHEFSTGDFVLSPKAGRAYEITEMGFLWGGDTAVAEVRIGGKPIMSFPISQNFDNVALARGETAEKVLFFDFLKEISPDYNSFKVSQGRTFRVTSTAAVGELWVRYKEWDEPKEDFIGAVLGENTPKMPYISYGKAEASVAPGAVVFLPVNVNLNPKEYMNFPWVGGVPAGKKLTLIGLCTARGAGCGPHIDYMGIKITDKDGTNVFGYEEEYTFPRFFTYPREYKGNNFFRFAQPLEYFEDDEMWVSVKVRNYGAAAQTAVITVTMFFNCEPAGAR